MKVEAAREAGRGVREPGHHGVGSRVPGEDEEAPKGHLMGLEGEHDLVGICVRVEGEPQEDAPDTAPTAGEDASPHGVAGAEVKKDDDEGLIGERAEMVLVCSIIGGEPCAVGFALALAAAAFQLYREWGKVEGMKFGDI